MDDSHGDGTTSVVILAGELYPFVSRLILLLPFILAFNVFIYFFE